MITKGGKKNPKIDCVICEPLKLSILISIIKNVHVFPNGISVVILLYLCYLMLIDLVFEPPATTGTMKTNVNSLSDFGF